MSIVSAYKDWRGVIANRRDVKRRMVSLLIMICEQSPGAALQGNRADDLYLGAFQLELAKLWGELSLAERTVLMTAKGCHTLPRGADATFGTSFGQLIQLGVKVPRGMHGGDYCWGSWINNAWEWCQQVIAQNPNAFADGAGAAMLQRVQASITAMKVARGF